MKLLSDKSKTQTLVAALDQHHCRIHRFKPSESGLTQIASGELSYKDIEDLETQLSIWTNQNGCRGIHCHWVLNRNLYQTFNVDPPNVLEKEMNEALKWQIKDLLELPVSEVIVSHYQPERIDNQNQQLVAVVVSKTLVEGLIQMTANANLELNTIDIEELTIGHALLPYFEPDRITGFIGEDKNGLVFNFYNNNGLSFTRHKKGKYMPKVSDDELSLEQDNKAREETFLLETQRTLDYVVSQIFRRPVDALLLQQNSSDDSYLVDLIKQITEIKVTPVVARVTQSDESATRPLLAEIGTVMRTGT